MELGLSLLTKSLLYFFKIYFLMLLARIVLYWFPNISYYEQPFSSLARVTDPYLRAFKGIVPLVFGMDFSPLLGFAVLQTFLEALSTYAGA